MNHPKEIIEAINKALDTVDKDISERIKESENYSGLIFVKKELVEMKNGQRLKASHGLNHMILDSMDWSQPCLKEFDFVCTLLRKHYRLRP